MLDYLPILVFFCYATCSVKGILAEKVILISFDHLPSNFLEIAKSNFLNVSAFNILLGDGSIHNNVSLSNITSETHGHSIIMSGRHLDEIPLTFSENNFCDQLISSQVTHNYEYLWMINQRMAFQSASYFWPQDYISINGSLPSFSFGFFPHFDDVFHGIGRIKNWLLSPSIKLISIFIPSPSRKHNLAEFYNETIENANNMLMKIINYVTDVANLKFDFHFVIVGGINPLQSSGDTYFFKNGAYKQSLLNRYVTRARLLESWLSPDEANELPADQSETGFIACPTKDYLRRSNYSGVLPSVYLSAQPNITFSVHMPEVSDSDRAAFILTSGPMFRNGTSSSTIMKLVDVYPLVCWLLGLRRPGYHDGSLAVWREYLKTSPTLAELTQFQDFTDDYPDQPLTVYTLLTGMTTQTLIFGSVVVVMALILGFTFSLVAIRISRYTRAHNGQSGQINLRKVRNRQFLRRGEHSQPLLIGGVEDQEEEDIEVDFLMANQPSALGPTSRGRIGGHEEFLNMLHGPLEGGGSRTSNPLRSNVASTNPK